MKIGEYEQMMAYLTRPGFNGGSGKKPTTLEELKKSGKIVTGDKYKPSNPKLIQAIRDFELRNPRKNKSEGGPLVPEPKPLTEELFKEKADRFIKGALGGFPKDEMITKLQEQLDKVQESGTFSKEQAINFINERTKQLREFIKQNPGETLPGLDRVNKAIGGGVIAGKDLGTREGFDEPYAVQKISKLGGEPFERVYTKKPGKKTVYDVDEEALKNEWRKTLTKKDPVPWKNFLEKKFPKGAEAIRKRIEAKKNFFPAEEFSVVGDKKRQDRLAKIEKLKEAHQKSDKFLYDAKSVAKKLKINLTRKNHAAELDLIDTFDSREDKIRKAFDKITLGNMKLYKPKRTASGNITAMNPVYKIISDMVSNPELSARYSTDARIINKALENHQPYLDIKDDFDYFAQNESSNFIGQNFKDGLEYAKYKRGGLDIKNTGNFSKVYALPEKNVLEFAIRNAYVNFKRGNTVDPKEAVELFYLKKDGTQGAPVDFNDLPKDKKSRARILNSDKVGFTYKGEFYNKKNVRTKGYKSDGSGVFNEVYEMSQKGRTLVPDPNSSTGKQISLKQLLGDTGDKLTIGHNDAKGGVAGSPFNDLRLEGAKFNASIFQAYDKVKDPKAREMIINNLQGKFKDLSGPEYEKLFIESKTQLAEDVFNNPEKVAKLPTYYRGAGQKVLADMGKTFFDESDDFKKEVSRVADIDLEEYEANKSQYKKNLILQLSRKNNLPPEMIEEDLTNVQKVLRKMQGQMNSGMDPKLLVEYLGAEMKDIAAFGSKYGGDVLGKVGRVLPGIDLPIFQTMFGAMYDLEQDSPVWLTLPAAFTDEVANIFNLYNKSKGRFGLGKAKDFGKFVASSFVPQVVRSPVFKAVSKVGKIGSMAAPVLELGKQAYLSEKRKGMLPEIARQFDIPIEKAREGYDNFVRQGQIRGMQSMVDDTEIPEMSQQGQDNLNSLINSFKQLGSLVGVTEDPYAEKESIYTRGKENPMSLDRVLYPDRQNFRDAGKVVKIISAGKKGLDYLKDFLKKKTITVKRGESGTAGASGADSNPDYRGKYYTPEGGGFGTAAEDARYYSKLGGDEGNPKVFTAELTPEEIEEGLRLRALDSQDPEIGDIILPKSAEDKVKIDYLNTIRAKLEKYFNMAEGGRVNFKDGTEVSVVTVDDKIDELISFYQDYLKQGGKMNFMTFAKKYIPQNFATGGRVNFADGPKDPSKKGLGSLSKRNFLKMLTLIPAGILAIRGGPNLFKKAKPALKAIKGMPDWFSGLVNKVIETGTDVTKQFAKEKGEQVFVKQLGEAEGVRVTKNLETGKVTVDYNSPTNMGEDTVTFTYRPGTKTEKGENIPAQFEASELEPRGIRMGPDDYEIEFDGEHLVEDINFLESDTSSLKQFATGKLDEKDLKLRQEKVKRVENINNDQTAQAEYLETKYGPSSDDANDYDLNYKDYSDYD